MKQTCLIVFLTVATFAAFAEKPVPDGLDGKPLSAKEVKKLESGKVLVVLEDTKESPVKQARAVGLIDAPPAVVMEVLLAFDRFSEFMAYVKETEVVGKKDGVTRVRYFLDLPWPVGNRRYVLHMESGEKVVAGRKVLFSNWSYEQGSGNINETKGYWQVTPYGGGRSFTRYLVLTDPGGKIPLWIRNKATEIAVPKVYEGVRGEVARVLREKGKAKPKEKLDDGG